MRFRAFVLILVLASPAAWIGPAAAPQTPDVTFFAIGDPQINIPKWGTAGTEQTIAAMNALPGTPLPSGGTVPEPRGVLIAGDLVDDTTNPENWQRYQMFFSERGDALLRFPVFEGVGNHDFDGRARFPTLSYVQRAVIERNRRRPGVTRFSADGYHYSWDWDTLHLVCLNVFPGTTWRPVYDRETPWNDPRGALDFLRQDLQERVGTSRRPVLVFWHYGLRGWGLEKWWTPDDLANLREVLAPYNIALILHGHEHRYERYQWEGFDVVMAPSPQRDRDPARPGTLSEPKGFLVLRLRNDTLEIAHRAGGRWQDHWTKSVQ